METPQGTDQTRVRRGSGSWIEQGKITASDAAAGDRFGQTVAMANGQVLVSAPKDDDLGSDSGAAYIYETCSIQVTVDPPTLQPGEIATVTWQTRLADIVTIQPATGSVAASGAIQVSPTKTTAYTISATGPGGTTQAQTSVAVSYNDLGAIVGHVNDSATGEPLGGVHIQATDANQAFSVSTDADGRFELPSLSPGTMVLHFSKDGYQLVEATLELSMNELRTLNISSRRCRR